MRAGVLAFAAWLLAAGAADAQLARVPLTKLPEQIQRDVVRRDGQCGVPPAISRRFESADVGPIGGPGRLDYYVGENVDYFDPPDSVHIDYQPRCTAQNYVLGTVWMRRAEGGYRKLTFPYPELYARGQSFLLQAPDPKCSDAVFRRGGGWWDCVRFFKWDASRERFEPASGDMTRKEAAVWAAKRGYTARAS